jgi:hypothetical protein
MVNPYGLVVVATDRVAAARQASGVSHFSRVAPVVIVRRDDHPPIGSGPGVSDLSVDPLNAGPFFGYGAAVEAAARVAEFEFMLLAPAGSILSPLVFPILDDATTPLAEAPDPRVKYKPMLPGVIVDAGGVTVVCLRTQFVLSPACPRVKHLQVASDVVAELARVPGMVRRRAQPAYARGPGWEDAYARATHSTSAVQTLGEETRAGWSRGVVGTFPFPSLLRVFRDGKPAPYQSFLTR